MDAQGSRRRTARPVLIALALVAVALVVLRLALPTLVKNYLNDQLADMGDYRGHITDVDIAIWRGSYALNQMNIVKIDNSVPVPFFEVDSIDLSISWQALIKGAVVAEVDFFNASLHFVDGGETGSQAGQGTDWEEALQQLAPIRIDRLSFHDSSIEFHNFQSEPSVHLTVTDLQATFTNLTNADRSEQPVYADFDLSGTVLGHAALQAGGSLDPLGDFRNFRFEVQVSEIDITYLNDLTEAYGRFAFESGTGDFVMEPEATDNQLSGYAKPLLDNVQIFDLEEDLEKGLLQAGWEALVGGLGRIFRNQPRDRIASQVDISGDLDQPDISPWQSFVSILRNAFVEAYEARFERE